MWENHSAVGEEFSFEEKEMAEYPALETENMEYLEAGYVKEQFLDELGIRHTHVFSSRPEFSESGLWQELKRPDEAAFLELTVLE